MSEPLRIVVLGMMGRVPFGGQTWLYLNWLRGLSRLGHDVYYVEDDLVWPYHPERNEICDDCGYAVRHIAHCMQEVGLPNRWAYRLDGREDGCYGLSARELRELYRSCDVLLNVVGATALREEHLEAPFRVWVQTDPAICELRLAAGEDPWKPFGSPFDDHHAIATYGENYGAPDCGVPLNGHSYLITRQPVDLDLWPARYDPAATSYTTVGNYRQEGSDVEWNGELYRWSKHHEWERFLDLPDRTDASFELALKLDDPADERRLTSHGWRVVPALPLSLDVFGRYREYLARSRGAFSVAKDQNVRLRSGWFSEREVCYLASGKPVVAQETGFSKFLPTGEGLFAFTAPEDALEALEEIEADYRRHSLAARAIAEEFFDARRVASRLLSDLGVA